MKLKWVMLKRFKKADKPEFGFADEGNTQQTSLTNIYGNKKRNPFLVWIMNFSMWFQFKVQPLLKKLDWNFLKTVLTILTVCIASGIIVSTVLANFIMNKFSLQTKIFNFNATQNYSIVADFGPGFSTSLVTKQKKSIVDRNLFNSSGDYPPDDNAQNPKFTKTKDLDFNTIPCSFEKLPVELIGTIYSSNPLKSFAILKDSKVPDADVYKAGDIIIEHEEYEVFKVNPGGVEARKGDIKICASLEPDGEGRAANTTGNTSSSPASTRPENIETIDLTSAFVTEQMGVGGGNIVNTVKFIPEPGEAGKLQGFKLLTIQPGSLFDKIKLQNGDIVAEVNGVSLKDPMQGTMLYESLQMEREVTIGIIRNGEPMTRKVRIK